MDVHDGGYGTSQMPLAGSILCCTSISPEQRAELAAVGSQMGATIKLDLTSDVTHLIVGSINSAKYRYVAKAREDVKVLSPEWLEALRAVWMTGDDVDVTALEREYRLPTFYGLKICLTGFDDPDQRKFIQETVIQNGAEYHGDLTKSVTHLIAATATGKKYEHALSWKMKIVSWEWFEESRQRGMALDENCYDPRMAVEDRGKGAWDRRLNRSPTPLGKRTRDAEPSMVNPLRRKLRRAASSRMGTQSEALWAGITAAGLEVRKNIQDDWTEDGIAKQTTSRESTVPRNVAVAPRDDAQSAKDPTSQPFKPLPLATNENHGIFEGRIVFAHGFDVEKTSILQQHLDNNGATVIRTSGEIDTFLDDDLSHGFLVVPHDMPTDLTVLPEGAGKLCLATNWWVERCLHSKSLVNPADNVLCRPFVRQSISAFDGLTVNSTAFVGIELLHVTKAITWMGAIYDENLTVKTSVIVCNTRKPNPEKLKFAADKRIPAVHSSWLWDCLGTGERQPFDRYLLNTVASQQKPRQKPQGSFTVVPTAPLSSEDSAKLPSRKAQPREIATKHPLKTSTKTKGAPQRTRILELAPSAEPTPVSSTELSTVHHPRTRLSFLHQSDDDEDDDDDDNEPPNGGMDAAASLPLQDINPGVNSPRRPSTSSNTSSKPHTKNDAPRKPTPAPNTTSDLMTVHDLVIPHDDSPINPPEDSVILADPPIITLADVPLLTNEQAPPVPREPIPEKKDHASIMASIMAARKAHAIAKVNDTSDEDPKKRRRRQLGRATSTRSNGSTADDLASRSSSTKHTIIDEGSVRDGEEIIKRKVYEEYQPSQELGWDAPGAQEQREQMIRAMGGVVEMGGMRVESIGLVKDVVSESVGGRGRKRRG